VLDDIEAPEPSDDDEPPPRSRPRTGGAPAQIAYAAMLGIAEVISPEKTRVEIEQTDDRPDGDDGDLGLSFGDLPPLD
jgi:hypothetical protein